MRLKLIILSLMFLVPSTGWSCAVCYGDPNDKMVQSVGLSVLFLLGMIAAVLAAFAWFFLTIRKREKLMDIPHGALVHERDRHRSFGGV